MVLRMLEQYYDKYDIRALSYDPWQLQELEAKFVKMKRLAIMTPQIGKHLSPLILNTDRMIREQTIVHDDDPLLTFCLENFQVKENRYGKLEFAKENSRTKIDIACALVVANNGLPELFKKTPVWNLPPVMAI